MRSCDKFSLKGPKLCQIHFTDSLEQQSESSLVFSVLALKKAGADRGGAVNPPFMMSQRGIGLICCLSFSGRS